MNYLWYIESDDCDRLEFFKQLEKLRPEAPVFLSMLNETRKQVRELRGPTRQHSAIQAYRYVYYCYFNCKIC